MALGARRGDLALEGLWVAGCGEWSRAALVGTLAGLPADPSVPVGRLEGLPLPGPTGHGLALLHLALGRAAAGVAPGLAPGHCAYVACPRTRRERGHWWLDPDDVLEALDRLEVHAGTRPLVVLLPWEEHDGPGDGSGALDHRLEGLARRPQTVIVAPTGNFGDRTWLWELPTTCRIRWSPDGPQHLRIWWRGRPPRIEGAGGAREQAAEPTRTGWRLRSVFAAAPVDLRLQLQEGASARLRPPFPSTGRLEITPPATSLGSVGEPACHPDVVAVGTGHFMSGRGLGGPQVVAAGDLVAAVREGPGDRCDRVGSFRGTSGAAAVHAGALLLAPETPPSAE